VVRVLVGVEASERVSYRRHADNAAGSGAQ